MSQPSNGLHIFELGISSYGNTGKLFGHQLMAERLSALEENDTKPMLMLQSPGTGKSGCFIAMAEHYKRSGRFKKTVIISRRVILDSLMLDIVSKYGDYNIDKMVKTVNEDEASPAKVARILEEEGYYEFKTYTSFATECENDMMIRGYTDVTEYFRDFYSGILCVFDEAHILVNAPEKNQSEDMDELGDEWISMKSKKFTMYVSLAAVNGNKVAVVTSTPLINGKSDSCMLGCILFGEDLTGVAPDIIINRMCDPAQCTIMYEPALARVVPVPDTSSSDRDLDRRIVETPADIMRGSSLKDYTKMYMTPAQTAAYVNIDERSFYKTHRTVSVAYVSPSGKIESPCLEDIVNRQIESWKNGEVGTRTVYFDDIVEKGADILASMLLARSNKDIKIEEYSPANHGEITGNFVFVVFKSGNVSDTARQLFNSKNNVGGKIIRLVIYTKIFKDGVSLYHALEQYFVVGTWTPAADVQSRARTNRATSFDALLEYFDNHNERTKEKHKRFFVDGKLTPLTISYMMFPRGLKCDRIPRGNYGTGDNVTTVDNFGSIDLHMFRSRCSKNLEICATMDRMIRSAVTTSIKKLFPTDRILHENRFSIDDACKFAAKSNVNIEEGAILSGLGTGALGYFVEAFKRKSTMGLPLELFGTYAMDDRKNANYVIAPCDLTSELDPDKEITQRSKHIAVRALADIATCYVKGGDVSAIEPEKLIQAALYSKYWYFYRHSKVREFFIAHKIEHKEQANTLATLVNSFDIKKVDLLKYEEARGKFTRETYTKPKIPGKQTVTTDAEIFARRFFVKNDGSPAQYTKRVDENRIVITTVGPDADKSDRGRGNSKPWDPSEPDYIVEFPEHYRRSFDKNDGRIPVNVFMLHYQNMSLLRDEPKLAREKAISILMRKFTDGAIEYSSTICAGR